MGIINILDDNTINLIAAGEVVERPGSVVKELVENSIDSGADKITVEIKNGGIEFIRITDNGSGIYKDDVRKAFYRHATSKIKTDKDLAGVLSMGFRGEALSSIASVARVELITKVKDELLGTRYVIEGSEEQELEEVGAPDGTTIIVRNLFYNTPARRKFLKSETAEGNNINDIIDHLCLSRPDISFKLIINGKEKITTSGRGDIKEIIYRLYGKETSDNLIPIDYSEGGYVVSGYLGKPVLNRPNRNFENYYINNRYIKNPIVSNGIEQAYSQYLMQHKFPFCVLYFNVTPFSLDVNVHPAKLEVRISESSCLHDFIVSALENVLSEREMIPTFAEEENDSLPIKEIMADSYINTDKSHDTEAINNIKDQKEEALVLNIPEETDKPTHGKLFSIDFNDISDKADEDIEVKEDKRPEINIFKPTQLSFLEPEDKVLSEDARGRFKIIGQVFDTYWMIEYADNLYFVDQHAAHEKVNYERLIKKVKSESVVTQNLLPPLVVTLSGAEMSVYEENKEYLEKVGFVSDNFGGNEISLRAIPLETYYNEPDVLFLGILDELALGNYKTPQAVEERIATMACKASVKGGNKISKDEMETLIDEMLKLDNPYNCPHGRPTIFSMSRYELEKKFKRVVD